MHILSIWVKIRNSIAKFPHAFQVEGFSINGLVLNGFNEPLPGATVILDGERTTSTGSDGLFKFINVKSGQHNLDIQAGKY